MRTVGILALQGDFEAHRTVVASTGLAVRAVQVRNVAQLEACDALILPGGESTTMLKLLDREQMLEPLKQFGVSRPIFGTCAGAILLAKEVTHPAQASLALMDITVERNGYGRQLDSRVTSISTPDGDLEAVFIRAPIIRRVGKGVTVVASYQGTPVWVEEGLHTVTTFHPELTADARVHRRFMERIFTLPTHLRG